jgi:hypothetical protein
LREEGIVCFEDDVLHHDLLITFELCILGENAGIYLADAFVMGFDAVLLPPFFSLFSFSPFFFRGVVVAWSFRVSLYVGLSLLPVEAVEFIAELLIEIFELLVFLLKRLNQVEQLAEGIPRLIEIHDGAHVKVVQHGAAS